MKIVLGFLLSIILASSVQATAFFETNFPLGMGQAKQKNWKEAIRIWKSCLKNSPSRVERLKLYFMLAKAYRGLGKNDLALKCAKRAQELAPSNAKITALVKKLAPSFEDRYARAKSNLRDALENDRMQDGAGEDLFEEACKVFKEAIDKSHDLAYSYYGYGTCLLELKRDRAEALKYLKKSYDLNSDNHELLYQLGSAALDDGDANQAVMYLEKCESSGKAEPEMCAALVRAWGRAGKQVPLPKISELVSRVATSNTALADGLDGEFSDSSIRSQISSIVSKAKAMETQVTASSTGGYSSSGSSSTDDSSSESKKTEEKEQERERTPVEKNYDKYNEVRYQQYLQHLSRLQSGKPSSWSGAIPKRPKKKDEK